MARGYFSLSYDLLRDVLHLPDDAEIVGVESSGRTTFFLWVEHSDIPEPKDNVPHKLLPIFKRVDNSTVTMIEWDKDTPLATLDVMEHNGRHTE